MGASPLTKIWLNLALDSDEAFRADAARDHERNSLAPGFPSWTLANEHRWPPARILPSPHTQQRLLFIF